MTDVKTSHTLDNTHALATQLQQWYNTSTFSDVTITCQDNSVRLCHKLVLSMASPIWATAFEDPGSTLDFSAHPTEVVDAVLEYCYSRRITVTDETLVNVHKFAFQYQLEALQQHCEHVMTQGLSASNCLQLYAYLRRHKLPTLPGALDEVEKMIEGSFAEAAQGPGFLALDSSDVGLVLARDNLAVTEDVIFGAAVSWLEAQPRDIQQRATDGILACVRWPLLSVASLLEFERSPLAEMYSDFRDQWSRALKWHAIKSVADESTRKALESKVMQECKHADALFRPRRGAISEIKCRFEAAGTNLTISENKQRITKSGGGWNAAALGEHVSCRLVLRGAFICM